MTQLDIIMADGGGLMIVDTNLFRLMPVSDLDSSFGSEMSVHKQNKMKLPVKVQDDNDSPNADDDSDNNNNDHNSVGASSFPNLDQAAINSGGYRRLSLVSDRRRRSSCVPRFIHVPMTDELHSELYSSTLESLREKVVDGFPQLETMVSLAVIHAFSPSTRKRPRHWMEEEAGATINNFDCWMQQQINTVFDRVRNGRMSPDAAAQQISEHVATCGQECANRTPEFVRGLVTCPRGQRCQDDSISLDLSSITLDDDWNDSWSEQIEHSNTVISDVPHLMGSLRDMDIDIEPVLQCS
jgi:hypothetical protein